MKSINFPYKAAMAVVFLLLGSYSAQAFPSWMGVYSYYQRHSGQNPGQFTIMMNEDYFGLNASVGYQVNEGGWQEFTMSYVTNKDGNSVWAYTPTNAFPLGAKVDFYFHGWEQGSSSNIYDSLNGANYHSGPLTWNYPEQIVAVPAYPGNGDYRSRIGAYGDRMYLASMLVGSPTFTVATRMLDRDWVNQQTLLGDAPIDSFSLAATPQGAVIAYATNTFINVRLSEDQGITYSAPIAVTNLPEGGLLSGLEVVSISNQLLGLVYGVSTSCCGAQMILYHQSVDGGHTWSAAHLVDAPSDFAGFFNLFHVSVNPQGLYVVYRGVAGGGGSTYIRSAYSADGTTWFSTNLAGNLAWSDFALLADATNVYVAADPYYDSFTRVWRSTDGTNWTALAAPHILETGRQAWLGTDWKGNLQLLRMEDNDTGGGVNLMLTSRVSTNQGGAWSEPSPVYWPFPVTPAEDLYTVQQVQSTRQKLYLLWNYNLHVNTFQHMNIANLQASDGFIERLDTLSLTNGQLVVSFTNLLGGLTYTVQKSTSPDVADWTNTVSGVGTNGAGTWADTPGGPAGFYRVLAPYSP